MDERDAFQALEAVINSDGRLFISITTPDWFLVPAVKYKNNFHPETNKEVDFNVVLQDAVFVDGFFEFENGKGIASELVSTKDQFGHQFWLSFLDETGRVMLLSTFEATDERSCADTGHLYPAIGEITLDSLAIRVAHQRSTLYILKLRI